ncbi:MAG TPA: M15 family metallopeptidase [Gemmatimonadales bacterium]|nr:M15 family metallopeptidase [Gemmatimonadales bacterium]
MLTQQNRAFLLAGLALAGCGGHGQPAPGPTPAGNAVPASTTSVEAPPLPIAPDSVADSLLVDVTSVDPTIQTDVRYAGANNFTGAPLPGYDVPRILLRREAAMALGRVQQRLKSGGLSLRVFDGYRPVRATLAMVAWAERTGRVALLDSGYIARRSRHNMGVAVDLTLVDLETGTEVPMGTPFDTFSEAAHTANAEGRVRRYRGLLVKVMEAEGFQNYDQEWWHFSYPVEGAVPFDRVVGEVGRRVRG